MGKHSQSKFRLGISAIFFLVEGVRPEALKRLAGSAFDCVEVIWHPKFCDFDIEIANRTAQNLRDIDVTCYSLHAPTGEMFDPSSEDASIRNHLLEVTKLLIEGAQILETDIIVMHASNRGVSESDRGPSLRRAADTLHEVACMAHEARLQLAIENLHHDMLGRDAEELDTLIDLIDMPNVGICFDTAHAYCDCGVRNFLKAVRSPIKSLHLVDNRLPDEEKTCWPFAPDGLIDWEEIVPLLREKTQSDVLMYEVYQNGCPDPTQDDIAQLCANAERMKTLWDSL